MRVKIARQLWVAAGLGILGSAQAQPVNYQIDPGHTSVVYEVLHFGTSTSHGRFPAKTGLVQIDAAAKTGKVEIEIDTSTPSSGNTALDRMLQGERFFKSAEFPTARFSADDLRFNGAQPAELRGQLTLLGVTHPVALKALRYGCYQNNMLKREVCGGDYETTIRRSQWGMEWGTNFAADEVRLLIQVEAVRQD
ncbi:MAG: YceI family protein [Pseudomonadota bacterium]